MKHGIPTTIGLLTLSATALGCSDAQKLANAYEKLCKADCECPEALEEWNEVSNCKNACEGYAKSVEAALADRETEPCGDFDELVSNLDDCAKESCDDTYACVAEIVLELDECWPSDDYDYYRVPDPEIDRAVAEQLAEIPQSIPRPLLEQALYSAAYRESRERE